MSSRYINGNRNIGFTFLLTFSYKFTGFFPYKIVKLNNKAIFFKYRDENSWGNNTFFRMFPSYQGFTAYNFGGL